MLKTGVIFVAYLVNQVKEYKCITKILGEGVAYKTSIKSGSNIYTWMSYKLKNSVESKGNKYF